MLALGLRKPIKLFIAFPLVEQVSERHKPNLLL